MNTPAYFDLSTWLYFFSKLSITSFIWNVIWVLSNQKWTDRIYAYMRCHSVYDS